MDKHLANHLWFGMLVLIFMSFTSYSSGQEEGCQYIIKTQTADLNNTGTTGKVRISLCRNAHECFLVLPDLAQYGERGPLYSHYFQQGRYSYFSLKTRASCSSTCQIILGHDNGGKSLHWLVNFVEVQALNTWGSQQSYTFFPIYGWLNRSQEVTVNRCLQDYGCNYEVWVQTGDVPYASMYGKVNLTLCDNDDQCFVNVQDLAQYGVKGPLATDYFARRSHSLFIIRTNDKTCRNPCKASVSHDGNSWFMENIIVDIYDGNNFQYKETFEFNQWIASHDISTVDQCKHYYDGTLPQQRAIS